MSSQAGLGLLFPEGTCKVKGTFLGPPSSVGGSRDAPESREPSALSHT